MFEGVAGSPEERLLLSLAIGLVGVGAAYLVRRARRALGDRINAVVADVSSAVVIVGIVVAVTVGVVDVWGQRQALVGQFGTVDLSTRVPELVVTVVVLVAVQVFAGIARRLLNDLTRESSAMTEHQREVSYRITQLVLWTVGLLIVLGAWNVNLGGLLIGAGFLGIVVGMAARQTLGSLLAGFVLMFSRPFEVGDWIEVEGEEGIVTDITMMNTRIQAFDGQYVVVPNDSIGSQLVKNRTRKGRLRIEVEVGIDYDADVERAREVATRTVEEVDEVMDVPKPEVVVKEFGDSAVTLGVWGWIENPSSRRRWRARTAMVREVKAAFEDEGIKIPYPQRELSGRAEEGGFRVRDGEAAGGGGREAAPPDAPASDGIGGGDE